MFQIIHDRISGLSEGSWVLLIRLTALAASFLFFIVFGVRLIAGQGKHK